GQRPPGQGDDPSRVRARTGPHAIPGVPVLPHGPHWRGGGPAVLPRDHPVDPPGVGGGARPRGAPGAEGVQRARGDGHDSTAPTFRAAMTPISSSDWRGCGYTFTVPAAPAVAVAGTGREVARLTVAAEVLSAEMPRRPPSSA